MIKILKVYTDGSCSGNPGKGGYGIVMIFEDNRLLEISEGFEKVTNNQMELLAMINTFKHIIENELFKDYDKLAILSDSAYVVNGINLWANGWAKNNWKTKSNEPVKNAEMWQLALKLKKEIETEMKLMVLKIKAHSGIEYNERADEIAKAATELQIIWKGWDINGTKKKNKKKA